MRNVNVFHGVYCVLQPLDEKFLTSGRLCISIASPFDFIPTKAIIETTVYCRVSNCWMNAVYH